MGNVHRRISPSRSENWTITVKRFWSLATVAAFVVGGTLACGSGAPEGIPDTKPTGQEQTAHWPDSLERFRFHWSSSPGLALTTGVAVPVRAYLESWYIASWTNGPENVYPGFLRATPESADLDGNYLGQLAWIRPLNGAPSYPVDPANPLGYMPMHIQSVDAVASGLRVTVCLGEYSIYFASDSSAAAANSSPIHSLLQNSRQRLLGTDPLSKKRCICSMR